MKRRDVQIGMKVEVKSYPWQGRTGVVRAKGKLGFYNIWCDYPDALGRQVLHINANGLQQR